VRNAFIERASKESERRFQELKGELRNTEAEFGRKACVYASGSFGREEAGPHSDIDLFIVRDSDAAWADSKDPETRFGGLEEIKLKYALLKALEKRGIPQKNSPPN
jgi:predicted nucleotidyltransferase